MEHPTDHVTALCLLLYLLPSFGKQIGVHSLDPFRDDILGRTTFFHEEHHSYLSCRMLKIFFYFIEMVVFHLVLVLPERFFFRKYTIFSKKRIKSLFVGFSVLFSEKLLIDVTTELLIDVATELTFSRVYRRHATVCPECYVWCLASLFLLLFVEVLQVPTENF